MKTVSITIAFLWVCFSATAQDERTATPVFPEIAYPAFDGTTKNTKEIFAKHELNIVLFWMLGGPSVRQLRGYQSAFDTWKEKYNVQLVLVTMATNMEAAKRAASRHADKAKSTILLDVQVREGGKYLGPKYSKDVPIVKEGITPVTLLIAKDGTIVKTLAVHKPQEKIDAAIAEFFSKE